MEIYVQLAWNILTLGALFGLMAASFSVIFSVTGVVHVAHGGVIMAAGYIFYSFVELGVPALAAATAGIFAAGTLGVILNILVYEPLRRRRRVGTGMMIASVALLIILQNTLLAVWSSQTRTIDLPFLHLPPYSVWGALVSPLSVLIFVTSTIMFLGIFWLMHKTRLGKAMRAVSDQEDVAEVVGINARRVRQITFFVGSVVAGVAGILAAMLYNLDPSRTVTYAVDAFSYAIVGGIGSIPGALFGTYLLTTLSTLGGFYGATAIKSVFAFLAAFVILLVRPEGLLGKKRL